MLEDRNLLSFCAFKSLNDSTVFTFRILFDDVLNVFYFFDSVFKSVNLCQKLIPFLKQVSLNRFTKLFYSRLKCFLQWVNSMQLLSYYTTLYWLNKSSLSIKGVIKTTTILPLKFILMNVSLYLIIMGAKFSAVSTDWFLTRLAKID